MASIQQWERPAGVPGLVMENLCMKLIIKVLEANVKPSCAQIKVFLSQSKLAVCWLSADTAKVPGLIHCE